MFDSAVLIEMYLAQARPSRPHQKTQGIIELLRERHVCGDVEALSTLQRLGAEWLHATPLIDHHGAFGDPDLPPADPQFTECRLAPLGELAAEVDLERRSPLPVGLIAGTLHSAISSEHLLGENDQRIVDFSPAFDAQRVLSAQLALVSDPSLSDDTLIGLVGDPVFPRHRPIRCEQLVRTGAETLFLRPTISRTRGRLRLTDLGPVRGVEELVFLLEEVLGHALVEHVVNMSGMRDEAIEIWMNDASDAATVSELVEQSPQLVSILRLRLEGSIPSLIRSCTPPPDVDGEAFAMDLADARDYLAGDRAPRSGREA